MCGSFLHPLTCGFARGVAWQISAQVDADENLKFKENETRKDYLVRLLRERYNRFSGVFQRYKENFPVDFKHFQAIFPPLREKFSRWNYRKIAERNQYTATFNIEAWNKLPPEIQVQHAFQNCKQCQLKYSDTQVLFPVKCKRFTCSMKENNPQVANKAIEIQLPSQPESTTLRKAGETAKSLYDQVNPMFEKITGHSLVKALTRVKDLNIQEKKSTVEKKRTVRNNYRKFKETVEKEWQSTSFVR